MGGVCSGGTVKKSRKSTDFKHEESSGFSGKLKSIGSFGKHKKNDDSYTYPDEIDVFEKGPRDNLFDSGELHFSISRELKSSTPARPPANKAPQVTSFLGKAGIVGLEKAVEVLDTLGSSMTNLNSGGFTTGVTSRGNRITILSFEVANTIAKGANLLQSLSEENVQFLKKEVLTSEGVRRLVSTDMDELLSIAAADKRIVFKETPRLIVRLDSDPDVNKQLRLEADMTMQELTTLAQHTSIRARLSAEAGRRETLAMLQSELKHQRKLVRSLKKKSLWSKTLEQVVEKLVDIVTFIHQEIPEVFGDDGLSQAGEVSTSRPERLGAAGLALHYANIITQIDNIASRPTSLPPNTRDTLYNGLPPAVKTSLRSRLQIDAKEELTVPQIKAEMEKSLHEFGKKTSAQNNLIRLQTLYHADKHKVESCILELVTWLHRLISLVRYRDNGLIKPLPTRSPTSKGSNGKTNGAQLSSEDRHLLEDVMTRRKLLPGLSKSQEFVIVKNKKSKIWALSRSTGSSPRRGREHQKADVLDILDGLDSSFSVPREFMR
ncbi:hypothetical protein PHJA_001670200 [Phtheirospermum japonicum]|uniref:Uncharacterized protein n=1 Tax=Phtheirospermum japonicum TaxID=374723 RepID=A0A830C7J1_9LAMI|nr:hypothetical protein PHJA_001670200 [Phtheirospermum japonicum]